MSSNTGEAPMGRLGTNWQGALLGGTNVGRMKNFANAH